MVRFLGLQGAGILLALTLVAAIGDFVFIKIRDWRSSELWFWLSSPLLILIGYVGSQEISFLSHEGQYILFMLLVSVALPLWLMALFYRVILATIAIWKRFRASNLPS
jgi:hypothetical protein